MYVQKTIDMITFTVHCFWLCTHFENENTMNIRQWICNIQIILNNRKFLNTRILIIIVLRILDFVNILFAQNHHLIPFQNIFLLFIYLWTFVFFEIKTKTHINKEEIYCYFLVNKESFRLVVRRIPFEEWSETEG